MTKKVTIKKKLFYLCTVKLQHENGKDKYI
jgi:hypothetical protein